MCRKLYHCSVCGKTYKIFGNMKLHENLHTEKMTLKYKCGVCGERFNYEGVMKAHMHVHTRAKLTTKAKSEGHVSVSPNNANSGGKGKKNSPNTIPGR